MDFKLSSEQEMLRHAAREFLAVACPSELARAMATDQRGFPVDLWQKIAGLGWTALPFPDQFGGAGGNLVDLAVLLEEMGRVSLPGLYLASMIGGLAILDAGTEQQKRTLLPDIGAGEAIPTLALLEPSLSYDPAGISALAHRNGAGYQLTGTKLFVPYAPLADYVVCAARLDHSDGLRLLLVRQKHGQAEGVVATHLRTVAGDQQYELVLQSTPVSAQDVLGDAPLAENALRRLVDSAAVAQCATLVGASQRVLELAVAQGQNRVQFGKPVGSFQAIQHHCANIVVDVDVSRFLTYQASWLLSEGKPAAKEVSMAKAFVGDAYFRIVTLGHAVLGGNGVIEEHEMPLFSKRAPGAQQLFGGPDYHREQVVRRMGL